MNTTKKRIAVERAESGVIQTGKEMAEFILKSIMDSTVASLTLRKQAKLFLRRQKRAQKLRLDYTIEYLNEGAVKLDAMVPEREKCS